MRASVLIQDWIDRELLLNRPQAILLVPVLMAFGIGGYFFVAQDPAIWIAPLVLCLCLLGLVFSRGAVRLFMMLPLLIVLGFTAAQIRAHVVYTPILDKKMNFADVQGRIEAIEMFEKGVRVLLSDVFIEDVEPIDTPRKIRLKLWNGADLRVGDRISALASLNPPSAPVLPGGFDFRRSMYFQGIGAVGFIFKPPEILQRHTAGDFGRWIEQLRFGIGQRISQSLDAPNAGLAMALMIGRRTAINEGDMQDIRDAGLAHMLAISGLHIGLFSGAVFFFVRLVMACFPGFALRWPIKKYAAVIAFFGALFYMGIAGATIPTQRAMISVGIVFLAMVLDRSAITLRVVACAAFVVLLLFPESLTSASFQMSFAAVTALVAFYDWLRPIWAGWNRQAGLVRKAGLYFLGVSMTTVIATLATAPLALYHFQQLPSYGLIANFVCVPILAFWVMPCAIVALLLMPFGLEGIALWAMEPGLSGIYALAHFTADLDGAVLRMPAMGFLAFVLSVLAGLALIALRGHLRVICVVVLMVMTFVNFELKRYDILISSKFELIAFVKDDTHLIVNNGRKDKFTRENWERALGFTAGTAKVLPKEGALGAFLCGEAGCRVQIEGVNVSYLRESHVESMGEECGWADLLLSRHPVKGVRCGAGVTVFDKFDTYKHGAHGIRIEDNERLVIDRAQDGRGARLWR